MKATWILFLLFMMTACSKERDNAESSKFTTGTYSGEKAIYYVSTHSESVDTILISFDNNTYSYSGSNRLDFGRGNYLLKNNSIDFNDEEARIALYTWDWILAGTHQLRITRDSLILNQDSPDFRVSCRLIKTSD
jgi:hypothetical protein